MPIKKISNLNSLASASAEDLLVIVDVDATTSPTGETKKIEATKFFDFINDKFSTGGLTADRWDAVSTGHFIDLGEDNSEIQTSIEVGAQIYSTGSIWTREGDLQIGELTYLGNPVPEFYISNVSSSIEIRRFSPGSNVLTDVVAKTFYGTASYFDRLTVVGTNALDVGGLSPNTPANGAVQIHNSHAEGGGSVAIGFRATASANTTVSIGNLAGNASSQTAAGGSVEIGYNTKSGNGSVAIGFASSGTGEYNVGVGYATNIEGTDGIVLGRNAAILKDNVECIVVGRNASVSNENLSSNLSLRGTAIGYSAGVFGSPNSIAIGSDAYVSGSSNSIAIGNTAVSFGESSISIGNSVEASGDYSISVGYNSQATQNNCMSIGSNVRNSEELVGEVGMWDGGRVAAVRLDGDEGFVALSLKNSANPPADFIGTHGTEPTGSLMQDAYSIRRNGNDIYIDVNIGGTVSSALLATVS